MIAKIITYNSLIHSSAWKKVGLWAGKEKHDKWAGGLWENANIVAKKNNHLVIYKNVLQVWNKYKNLNYIKL